MLIRQSLGFTPTLTRSFATAKPSYYRPSPNVTVQRMSKNIFIGHQPNVPYAELARKNVAPLTFAGNGSVKPQMPATDLPTSNRSHEIFIPKITFSSMHEVRTFIAKLRAQAFNAAGILAKERLSAQLEEVKNNFNLRAILEQKNPTSSQVSQGVKFEKNKSDEEGKSQEDYYKFVDYFLVYIYGSFVASQLLIQKEEAPVAIVTDEPTPTATTDEATSSFENATSSKQNPEYAETPVDEDSFPWPPAAETTVAPSLLDSSKAWVKEHETPLKRTALVAAITASTIIVTNGLLFVLTATSDAKKG
ncbi:MAG: hypothetical protein ACOYK9_04180 [Chlamydiia bacterium]